MWMYSTFIADFCLLVVIFAHEHTMDNEFRRLSRNHDTMEAKSTE